MSEVFKITEEELNTIKKVLDIISGNIVEQQPKTWPQDGDEYFTYDRSGELMSARWGDWPQEKVYLDLGLIYISKNEFYKDKARRIAETKVIRRLRGLELEKQSNYFPHYKNGFFSTDRYQPKQQIKTHPPSWYSTEAAWIQVWEEMPEAIKTMLGVE